MPAYPRERPHKPYLPCLGVCTEGRMFGCFAACRVTASASKSITRWKPGSMARMSASDVWVSRVSLCGRTMCAGQLSPSCRMLTSSSLPTIAPPFLQPISRTRSEQASSARGVGSTPRTSLPWHGPATGEPGTSRLRYHLLLRYRDAPHGPHLLSATPRACHHAQCDDCPHCDARGPP